MLLTNALTVQYQYETLKTKQTTDYRQETRRKAKVTTYLPQTVARGRGTLVVHRKFLAAAFAVCACGVASRTGKVTTIGSMHLLMLPCGAQAAADAPAVGTHADDHMGV